MGFLMPQTPVSGSLVQSLVRFSAMSMRSKLLLTVIPLVGAVLLASGYTTKVVASRYLNMALERTTKVLTMGQANAVAELLEGARQDLLFLAQGDTAPDQAMVLLAIQSRLKPGTYREAAYIPFSNDKPDYLVDMGKGVASLDKAQMERVFNSPLMALPRVQGLKAGSTALLGLAECTFPPGLVPEAAAGMTYTVFRMITPVADASGALKGLWLLSLDGRAVRDILSLYNSPRSPLAAFPRTAVKRYSFFFDASGWILFQSGNIEEREFPLSTDVARSGLVGDHGMTGFPGAFRPAAVNDAYWRMVVDVQGGQAGIESVGSTEIEGVAGLPHDTYSLGYAPVYFLSSPERGPEVVGGVAFMDKSKLLLAAEYQIYDVLMVIFAVALVLSGAVIFLLARIMTRPIHNLADAVRSMPASGELRLLDAPTPDKETAVLKDSINALITNVMDQRQQLREKDAHINDQLRRQPLDLDDHLAQTHDDEPMEGLVGASPAMRELKWLVHKAASVDPDVLIIGETGTGKEVTAQAIHRLSHRATGPFISINCGALDENLLMDALFGHVKGAFSEAKTDRKGAFLAAHGGTILLDEIGNASPKVQQALLRALAARTILPLGSDAEVGFDARNIAATNVDLLECLESGTFREDLYYRLRVLTLNTPPLRERMEDIPLLVDAFLRESAQVMSKGAMTLSRGAWERISSHTWPGNVRELKHCLMRAVAMSDSNMIYVEDLRFDAQSPMVEWTHEPHPAESAPAERRVPDAQPRGGGKARGRQAPPQLPRQDQPAHSLNERQAAGMDYAREHGGMTRAQYQRIVGENIPPRTAQYDLRDLVERGLLTIKGKGPATRYLPAETRPPSS